MGDVIKTIGRLVTLTLRDFVDEAPARATEVINSLNRQNYYIEMYIVVWVIIVSKIRYQLLVTLPEVMLTNTRAFISMGSGVDCYCHREETTIG